MTGASAAEVQAFLSPPAHVLLPRCMQSRSSSSIVSAAVGKTGTDLVIVERMKIRS